MAAVHYEPSLVGNSFFLLFFDALLLIQFTHIWNYKTWAFTVSVMGGSVFEVVGYVGRMQMHFNPFAPNHFLTWAIEELQLNLTIWRSAVTSSVLILTEYSLRQGYISHPDRSVHCIRRPVFVAHTEMNLSYLHNSLTLERIATRSVAREAPSQKVWDLKTGILILVA